MLRFKTYINKNILKEELTLKQKMGFNLFSRIKGIPPHINNEGEITASPNAIDISKHVIPEGQDSIEIPAKNDIVNDIHEHLKQHNYHEVDYANKTAYKTVTLQNGSTKKVGKSIGSILQATKAPQDLINRFANDNHKESADFSKKYKIIISRNPYHIAECSTNKSWSSCDALSDTGTPSWDNPELGGHKLPEEINHGSHVAYLVNNEDKPHQELIDNATARTFLKPYTSNSGHTVLVPEEKSYIKDYKDGVTAPSGFINSLTQFTNKHFPMEENILYTKNKHLYNDDGNINKINITNLNNPISKDINSDNLKSIMKNANISKEHIHEYINSISDNHPNIHLLNYLPLNKNFDSSHINNLINNKKLAHLTSTGLLNLSEKPLSSENIHGFINQMDRDNVGDYGSNIAKRLVKQKTIDDTHIDSLINIAKSNPYSSLYKTLSGITDNTHNNILKPKHIDKLLEFDDKDISINLSSLNILNSKHIDKLLKHKSRYIDENLSTNTNLNPNHISSLLNRHINSKYGKEISKNITNRSDLNSDHIHTIINSGGAEHLYNLINNRNLTDNNISDIIDKGDTYTNVLLSQAKSLNSHHISKLLQQHATINNYESESILKNIVSKPTSELNSSHINDILDSPYGINSDMVDMLASYHGKKLNDNHISKILNAKYDKRYSEPDYSRIATLPQLKSEHIDKLLDYHNDDINQELAKHKNLNADHIHKLIDHNDPMTNSFLLGNNIKEDHYQRILKHMQKNPRDYNT